MSTATETNPLPAFTAASRPMDPMDPVLDVFRPDRSIVDKYVSRTLPGGIKDTDFLLDQWRKRKNIFLKGDTQAGKTMVIQVIACLAADELGYDKPLPVFTLSGSSGVTDYDLFGQPSVYTDDESKEALVWLPGILDLATLVENAILYIDEPSMMDERVNSSLHPVCDDRRMYTNRQKAVKVPGDGFMPEVRHVLDSVWIVGSYNEGYRGTAPLSEAFANRFAHLPWDYDEAVETQLLFFATVREFSKEIRLMRMNSTIRTPVGVTLFQQFEEDLREYGVEMAYWKFCGVFTPDEKARVMAHVENISMLGKIEDEIEQTAIFGDD
jgi:MoxR-like ATPase